MSVYDLAADLLKVLYKNDDILLEEDYDDAVQKAEALYHAVFTSPVPKNFLDVLKSAKDKWLDQEDLFALQNAVEDFTREMANKEHRWPDFYKTFPWM